MIIINLNEGPKADYSINGTVLKVQEVAIDLAARQRDVQNVVDVSLGSDLTSAAEGVGAWYIATIIVPPLEYDLVDSGKTDENGNPIMVPQAMPLDMSKVELRLWALPRLN
jgi:hypothetical protein